MPGLNLVSGNRLELLAERCGSLFMDEPLPPLAREVIVLQSMGMMQWLSIRLADKLGIWADFEYVLPNKMTSRLMKSFFPGLGDERFFDKDIMTWKTMGILRGSGGGRHYSRLHDYIKNDVSGIRGYQLASRITDIFDQYMTFRPDMILRWGRKEDLEDEEWQPRLWRDLTSGMGGIHPPSLLENLFSGISDGTISAPEDLPSRITVFGVSYLPLYHLNILSAVSSFCDVYIYMLNPCKEYWADIMREKEITSFVLKQPVVAEVPEDELHLERGNPLLSSMGRAGRDFFRFLYMSGVDSGDEDFFEDPGSDSILHILQGDILAMTARGERGDAPAVTLGDAAALSDLSVVINSCHSIMREVEVLHDYLLELFNSSSELSPGDVLVMTPDIEACSSIIQGVFDRREEGLPRIPYRIVDRRISNTSRVVDTFMKILSLPEGRFTSTDVMAILQCPDVLMKFGLSGDDFDSIGAWVIGTNIYWGIDSKHKGGLGLPEIYENTWSFGVERMLLGSVMACSDDTPLGILPYPGIEGGDMQVLGRFISFLRLLKDTYYELSEKRTPDGWGLFLNHIAESFFEPDSNSSDDILQIVRAAARLREIEVESGFAGTVGLSPVKEFIEKNLGNSGGGRNFITGALTFCEMLPMRSIPCKVICLIGMNEYSFPRKARPSGFDLMMKKPRTGDRSVRDEDRYLFLETVLSARERLYISYTGQNITTNKDQNPSIVVSELMECIDESFRTEGGKRLNEFIFKKQRLQSYHPDYFTDESGYYSFSPVRLKGASSYVKRESGEYRFFTDPLPPLSGDERSVSIDDLVEFIINPAKYLIKRRLGINLDYYAERFREEEIFVPDGLERFGVDGAVFNYIVKGLPQDEIYRMVKAEGVLPHGAAGEILFKESAKKSRLLYDSVGPLLVEPSEHNLELEVNGITVRGRYTLYNGKQIFHRTGSLRARDRLRAWIYHLVVCCAGDTGKDFFTTFVTVNGKITYKRVDKSSVLLEKLAVLYEKGMCDKLPLFPESSYLFVETSKLKDEKDAFSRAMNKFRGARGKTDMSDPYIARLFGESYMPGDDFIEAAKSVYLPVTEYEEGE